MSDDQVKELDEQVRIIARGSAIAMRMSLWDEEDMHMAGWIAFLRTGTFKYMRPAINEEARRLKYDQKSHNKRNGWKAPRRVFYSLEHLETEHGEYWWRELE